ncbi:MAG: sn-glycerol-3-phosphate ABC transporter ATP-binding protein UgpC [Theionarchaea archaeon]|nr:sn-glycerol-3-phosphate ABC transporter ATP-binding protein UgpC [Theionarchaea archaeon]
MASVDFKHVTKKFGIVIAVNDINFTVRDKEFLILVGPSGCGKSTTLRMVAGLEEITTGEIYIGERLVNTLPPKDRDIAMVFQNYALYPHMNVYENMSFALRLRKYPKEEIEGRVQEAAHLLEIETLLDRKPKELSGGQRQRVAVGRAIVRKPAVFLFDEPLSNLDAKLRTQMRTELSRIHEKLSTTIIYVTHDQAEAMTMGDRIVVMKDGIIHQIDTPQHLYDHPVNEFVAGFIGSPSMNFLDCTIVEEDHTTYVDTGIFSITVPQGIDLSSYVNKEMIFGIRPEDLHDSEFISDTPHKNSITARVTVREPMGSDVFLYLEKDGEEILARVNAATRAEVGTDINIIVDVEKMHLFNKSTRKTIL